MNSNQRAPPSRSSTQAAAQSLQSSHPNAVLDQGVHTRTSSMLHPSTTSSIPSDPWASSHESVATLYGGRPALPADAECPTPNPIWMLCQLDEVQGKALRMPLASLRNFLCAIGVTRMHDGVDSELANKIILEWYHLQRVNRARQHKAAVKQQPTFAQYLSQQPTVPISVDAEAALKRVASRRKENKKDTPASADPSPEKPPRLDISYEHQIGQLKERLQNFKVESRAHRSERREEQNDSEILARALIDSRREIGILKSREKNLFQLALDRELLDEEVEARHRRELDKKLAEARLHAKQEQDQVLKEANESHKKELDRKNNAIRDRDEIHMACLRRIEELGGQLSVAEMDYISR